LTATVIVGAGLGGLRTAEALRQHGYAEPITLIGAEKHAPYTRPPLSKEVLRGDADLSKATLRGADALDELGLDVRLGRSAIALDVEGRQVSLDDGSTVAYEHLVIATGATPRRLRGPAVDDAHVLRSIDDCLDLQPKLVAGAKLSIIGAGFIGLEVAACARSQGCEVTVIDVLPEPLARVLPVEVGQVVRRLHEANGVVFTLGSAVDTNIPLDADVIVMGVGAAPETSWLETSGLTIDNGVVCDESLSAGPGVWAVGDVARWAHPSGELSRVEHWTNATEQAQTVARNIVNGTREPFETVPYFWSDQYDAKLQSLGFIDATDEMTVVWGSLDEPKWVALLARSGRLTGVVGLRAPGRVMKLRPLLAAGASYDDAVAFASA